MNAGTAGVWRIAAINEAGGWKDRTTVEDMDLAVRASLKGWKFLYLGSVQVFFQFLICLILIVIQLANRLCIMFANCDDHTARAQVALGKLSCWAQKSLHDSNHREAELLSSTR